MLSVEDMDRLRRRQAVLDAVERERGRPIDPSSALALVILASDAPADAFVMEDMEVTIDPRLSRFPPAPDDPDPEPFVCEGLTGPEEDAAWMAWYGRQPAHRLEERHHFRRRNRQESKAALDALNAMPAVIAWIRQSKPGDVLHVIAPRSRPAPVEPETGAGPDRTGE